MGDWCSILTRGMPKLMGYTWCHDSDALLVWSEFWGVSVTEVGWLNSLPSPRHTVGLQIPSNRANEELSG